MELPQKTKQMLVKMHQDFENLYTPQIRTCQKMPSQKEKIIFQRSIFQLGFYSFREGVYPACSDKISVVWGT